MACFLVPATEAIVTTVATKVMKKKGGDAAVRFSAKLSWLNNLLWGGSVLLALEHVWHGEVIPAFPFLTAVQSGDTAGMLTEMGTTGVAMALLVTAVWGGMVAVSNALEKRAKPKEGALAEEGAP